MFEEIRTNDSELDVFVEFGDRDGASFQLFTDSHPICGVLRLERSKRRKRICFKRRARITALRLQNDDVGIDPDCVDLS